MVAESGTPASAATARWVTASAPWAPITRRVARRIASLRCSPFWYIREVKPEQRYQMATALPQKNPLDNITYEDLYRRWEKGNWQAMAIDFSQDAESTGARSSPTSSARARCGTTRLFFWGEDAVADGLSPYIDAAPTEEQKYFLTTQQVDEARHAVFFNRFMKDVVGIGGDRISDGLSDIKPQLTWGFTKVFDRLVDMSDELRRDPRSRAWPRR